MKRVIIRTFCLTALLTSAALTVGCGSQQSTAVAENEGPAHTVKQFLDAVKRGDDASAGGLLTPIAQQKTAEMDMVVAPPGSDTATYALGEVRMASETEAQVASSWTDIDHEGNPRTDNITWIVKQTDAGWRIAGMSAKIFPEQPEIVLNFEDPTDMLNQQRMAEETAYRQANPQQQQQTLEQARRPEDPFQGNTQR